MDVNVKRSLGGLRGEIEIPADKSISHRAVMFSSLANGKSKIKNFLYASDCRSTVSVFKNLGVDIEFIDEHNLIVNSNGKLIKSDLPLDCGNSGTTMRLVSGILAGQNFDSVLVGDASLSKRPMKRVIEPLKLMGAEIDSLDGKAPLKIYSKKLKPIEYNSPIASAQVKSCILLAGMGIDGITTVNEPYLSRNHTELMLKYMGANITTLDNSVSIQKSELEPREITVAGDISSAAFFIVAALITPGSDIIIKNVGLNPTRTGIIDVVKNMNGNLEILDERVVSGEKVGDIRVKYSELKATDINGSIIPRLIDELPVIALLATQADGVTKITDAGDLRNKEADRISAVVNELRKIGVDIDELDDGFIISGTQKIIGGATLETYHDHRLAMTFYIAGLISQKEILVKDFQWVDISMPEFLPLITSIQK